MKRGAFLDLSFFERMRKRGGRGRGGEERPEERTLSCPVFGKACCISRGTGGGMLAWLVEYFSLCKLYGASK